MGAQEAVALRITWGIPILLTSGAALLCLRLSPQVEAAGSRTRPPLSAAAAPHDTPDAIAAASNNELKRMFIPP